MCCSMYCIKAFLQKKILPQIIKAMLFALSILQQNENLLSYSLKDLGWEFIKEKKKTRKKENKNSYKKTRTKTRKKELVQESVHANKNSCKKTRTKTRTRTRKRPRKKELVQENTCFLVRVLVFFLACFLFFFYKFPAQE